MTDITREDAERLYRAIADRTPHAELLQMLYDLVGDACELRPPVSEQRLADMCKARVGADA